MTDKPGVVAIREFACPSCDVLAGAKCVTVSGNECPPHVQRWRLAEGWIKRQGEVDGLQQAVDRGDALLSAANDALRTAEHNAADLAEQLKTARAGAALVPSLRDQIADLLDDKAELEKRIEELTKPVDPEPTGRVLPFGVGVDQLGTIETKAGAPVAYHRTYFTLPASGVHTKAVAQAKADHVAGRTPVMSFKLPGGSKDWAGAATGKFDAPIKAAVDALAALGKTVIVAVHHEPEDDGTLDDFKAMTAHLVDVVKRPTVQFWVCFMGYHQLYGGSAWKLDQVHVPGVDGYGFDPYLSFGASSTKWTDQTTSYYAKFGAWAKQHGVQWGIWETGINEQAITSGRTEAKTWFADMVAGAKKHGASMWIYFSSETTLDGKHDWRISTTGADKQAQFAAVVKQYAPSRA